MFVYPRPDYLNKQIFLSYLCRYNWYFYPNRKKYLSRKLARKIPTLILCECETIPIYHKNSEHVDVDSFWPRMNVQPIAARVLTFALGVHSSLYNAQHLDTCAAN